MAKRRQLEVPSEETLKEMEEGFRRETAESSRPPIADVVADAASLSSPLPLADREAAARDKVDAETLRQAVAKGLIATEVPIEHVMADAMSRDRMDLDSEELDELVSSIVAHGLRLPIEVYEPSNPEQSAPYALISGYRRLAAFRHLNHMSGGERYKTIPAFIRQPEDVADTFVSMIEENEIRSSLSQYERGRAAAMAVYEGVFKTVDEAVARLFHAASKAKRSKIRSFALVHEELGDMLSFATEMTEKQCLRLATALRAGLAAELREALDTYAITSVTEEWQAVEPIVEKAEGAGNDPARGGRPKLTKSVRRSRHTKLANGISMEREEGPNGYAIRFHGNVSADMVDRVMDEIRHLLEPI